MLRSVSILAVLVLMTVGLAVAGGAGSAGGVLLTVVAGTLVLSYAVRRGPRAHRRTDTDGSRHA